MTPPVRTEALVLRTRPLAEHDLVVELLGRETGRLSAVARGARNSRRRFGGVLEIGARVDVELRSVAGRELRRLEQADVRHPLRAIRGDLERFQHLAYVLELAHLCFPPEQADPEGYALVTLYVDALEAAPPRDEALTVWELNLLRHLGHGMTIGRCPLRDAAPDALSLQTGAAVSRAAGVPDAIPLDTAALRVIAGLERGHPDARFDEDQRRQVRRALSSLWRQVTGHEPRSARFLGGV